jgi:hypothetical protein
MVVQRVMTLRIMRLASGGTLAATEARQMISEKVSAFEEAQVVFVQTCTPKYPATKIITTTTPMM